MNITKHAIARQSNRGISTKVLDIVFCYGEFVGNEEIFMSRQSVRERISEYRAELIALQIRWSGSKNKIEKNEINHLISISKRSIHVVERSTSVKMGVSEDTCVTCMHTSGRGRKILMRRRKSKFVH
jgi:hypothetical protein